MPSMWYVSTRSSSVHSSFFAAGPEGPADVPRPKAAATAVRQTDEETGATESPRMLTRERAFAHTPHDVYAPLCAEDLMVAVAAGGEVFCSMGGRLSGPSRGVMKSLIKS